MNDLERLLDVMARLRGEDGCPWDREQTTRSLRPYVLEEAHEVAEAIDRGDPDELRGELGDLLLQVVFLSRIAEERGEFAFDDVARGIAEKLERRHPHVFGDAQADTVAEVWRRWDRIKQSERGGAAERRSRLDGLPQHLPALVRARLVADKASRAGFDWPGPRDVLDKIGEEVDELRGALDGTPEQPDEELGDLLFAVASLARHLDLDPEGALQRATKKFSTRFRRVEELAAEEDVALEDLDAAALDRLWERAKG
jgi:MazG family protein